MASLKQLNERRELLIEQQTEIHENAGQRGLSNRDQTKWNQINNQLQELNQQIKNEQDFRLQLAQDDGGTRQGNKATTAPAAALFRALHSGKTTKVNNENEGEFVQRALTSSTGSNMLQNPNVVGPGGVIFDAIYNSPLETLGVDVFDLGSNYARYPKVTGYPMLTAYTESQSISEGTPVVEAVDFTAKNYGVYVKVHNNLLRDAGPHTDRIIQGVFERAIHLMFLRQGLRGLAANNEFTGLDNYAGVQTLSAGSAALTNYDLIVNAAQKVMAANGGENIGVVMHPAIWAQLQNLKATDNQPLLKPAGIREWPMIVNTVVGTEYGAGSDETRLYVGDFSTVKLGIEGRYEMRLDQTFATDDQTGFVVVVRADMQLFHPERMVRIEDIAIA